MRVPKAPTKEESKEALEVMLDVFGTREVKAMINEINKERQIAFYMAEGISRELAEKYWEEDYAHLAKG